MKRIATLAALLYAGCDSSIPENMAEPPSDSSLAALDCPVIDSANWEGWISDTTGSDTETTLRIAGMVTMPSPNFTFEWAAGYATRSASLTTTLVLIPTLPDGVAGDMITSEQLSYEGPLPLAEHYPVGTVSIMCGETKLAEITEIDVAR